jgi:hypothetical protein
MNNEENAYDSCGGQYFFVTKLTWIARMLIFDQAVKIFAASVNCMDWLVGPEDRGRLIIIETSQASSK